MAGIGLSHHPRQEDENQERPPGGGCGRGCGRFGLELSLNEELGSPYKKFGHYLDGLILPR